MIKTFPLPCIWAVLWNISLELFYVFMPQLEAYMFHFDFAARDTRLNTRFPRICFLTIKGMACLCRFTQQQMKLRTAVVPRRRLKHSLQKQLQQRDGHGGKGGDVICLYWWWLPFNDRCSLDTRCCHVLQWQVGNSLSSSEQGQTNETCSLSGWKKNPWD